MNLETISIIGFFVISVAILYFDRKKIEFHKGVIYRRTKKGKKTINKIAKKHKKFFKIFGIVSVFIAFAVSIGGVFLLLKMTQMMIIEPEIGASAKLVVPAVPIKGLCTHAFCVPFWFWIISIFVIITPHELSHGLLMAAEKIKIKSLGLIWFFIFPGAFVEPDEKQFQKAKPVKRMKIASVGSIANIILFFILGALLLSYNYIGSKIYKTEGIDFEGLIDDTPAKEAGISGTIIEVNNNEIKNYYDFSAVLLYLDPGDRINIVTTEAEYEFNTIAHPQNESLAFIGIENVSTKLGYTDKLSFLGQPSISLSAFDWTNRLLYWIILLDINVAIINLLPFLPFDGGIMWHSLFEKYCKKHSKPLILGLTFFVYGLLLINLIGIERIMKLFI